ncbi:hypothetical protein, partial [Mycobacteroides abscessus]
LRDHLRRPHAGQRNHLTKDAAYTVNLTDPAIEDGSDWVPQSCSLPSAERPLRVAEFDRLFGESAVRSTRVTTTRLDVELDAAAQHRARDLAARESECCSYFTFTFETVGPNVVMRIEVPPSQSAVLDALAGRVDVATRGGVT